MRVKFEFDLNNEVTGKDDEYEMKRMLKATKAYIVLWDMQEYLRSLYKYGDEETMKKYNGSSSIVEIETVREKFRDLLDQHNINLDDELE